MMNLFEKLPYEDVKKLNTYINRYGGTCDSESYMPLDNMEYFLRFWNENKVNLYKMLGEQFIVKKEIFYEREIEDLAEDMDCVIWGGGFIGRFRSTYVNKIDALDLPYILKDFVTNARMLANNIYGGQTFEIPGTYTVNGKPLQVPNGCKVIKMLGKVCDAIGVKVTGYKCEDCGCIYDNPGSCCGKKLVEVDGYETFRREHSLVLNQKKVRGNLCLSIHPLDYITMSDNTCGWSSCMCWMEDPGDYRLGTIEMMTSKYVLVAYIESKDELHFGGWGDNDSTWNSKRWRQLVVVTPELILGNKQYPYDNDFIQGAVLKWVRELAEKSGVFGLYNPESVMIRNSGWNTIGDREIKIRLWFDYMYNDIYDLRQGYVAANLSTSIIEYNLSGPAVCTECGGVISRDEGVESSWTVCLNCSGMWRCACCGDMHSGEAYYTEDSDDPYCHYCYYNDLEHCEVCESIVSETTPVYICIDLAFVGTENAHYNWSYAIDVCNCCFHSASFEKLFGPIIDLKDMYGNKRCCVMLNAITEEGLNRGSLSPSQVDDLRQLQKIEGFEDRLNFVKENLY